MMTLIRRSFKGLFFAVAMIMLLPIAQADSDANTQSKIRAAMAGEHRDKANIARDYFRHPFETLSFFGLRDDMTVVELWPGGGWYTEILAPVLREQGTYYAASFNPAHKPAYRARIEAAYRAKLAAHPGVYDKVQLRPLWAPKQVDIAPAGSVDLVLSFRNSHNWNKSGDAEAVYQAAYKALKPGGVLGVVQHRGKAGADPVEPYVGYVDPAYLIQLIQAQGFRLDASSEINANQADTKNHPNGVWSLPPAYRGKAEDRERYAAIGESDRMTLRFIKPKQ